MHFASKGGRAAPVLRLDTTGIYNSMTSFPVAAVEAVTFRHVSLIPIISIMAPFLLLAPPHSPSSLKAWQGPR